MGAPVTGRFSIFSLPQRARAKPDATAGLPEETPADEAVLERISAGDCEAFRSLFRKYTQLVYHVGRQILRDECEADDLVQDVFLYIHRKSALFNPSKGAARSWILQVAYTQAFLRRRHLKSHGFYSSGMRDKSPESDPVTSARADYDRTVEGLFGRAAWQKVLEVLTEEQRETLRLHFFEDLTFAEIAEKLGQTYANVRNHHYRGLEKLRRHLKV